MVIEKQRLFLGEALKRCIVYYTQIKEKCKPKQKTKAEKQRIVMKKFNKKITKEGWTILQKKTKISYGRDKERRQKQDEWNAFDLRSTGSC